MKTWSLLLVALLLPSALAAQEPVAPEDYAKWQRLGPATLSHDGEWLAYGIDRVEKPDELRVRRLGTDSVVVIEHGTDPVFSEDDRWLAYTIGVSEEKREKLQEKGEPVRHKLGLMNLITGDTLVIEGVADFAFSDGGGYLALRRYPPEESDGSGAAGLVVRHLGSGTETHFGNVTEFAWSDEGTLLAMVIDAPGGAGYSVQLYDPAASTLRTLASGAEPYTGLAWHEDAADLAVLRARTDTTVWADTAHVVLAWRGLADGTAEARVFDPAEHAGFPDSMRVVAYRPLEWSDDGRTIFFGIQERERSEDPVPADTTAADSAAAEAAGEEPAQVLVWHADDVDIIPRQKVTADRDRRDNYLSAWHLGARGEGRFVRLGTELTEDVRVVEGTGLAIGTDQTPYRRERMFGPVYHDVYTIDVETGERAKAIDKVQYFFGASPGGRYLLYLENDHYWTYDLETGERTRITEGVPTSFVDLDDDHTVEQKPPFGVAGWLEGGGAVLLYGEYDIWRVAPDGSGAVKLTHGAADSVRHRYVDLETGEEAEERDGIDPSEPLYLDLYDAWSEMHGYARMRIGERRERLVWRKKEIDGLEKADDAPVYVYEVEDFNNSPDYFVAGPRLQDPERVTHTNPFQDEYAWGRSELIAYETRWGERLQGALFYPADYDPGETYPMIVYIYETRSPSVRNYYVPSKGHPYNPAVFTAEGYFVFQPDIVYRARNPGRSAVAAIVPAVDTVLDVVEPIDSARVGLVGHSWGGYQTAFTVTQTDIFSAAVAGAPLTNLVSMYGSIYWRTGGTDARIFEISQGRMEVPPWRDWEAYMANSPLHNIQGLHTPLLIAAGTDDGAVEFNQQIEFYNAARRAGKELVLLVYKGEGHGISREEEDARDYHERVLTWFDHYLKGEPAPAWITEGVPYLEQMDMRKGAEEDGGEEVL